MSGRNDAPSHAQCDLTAVVMRIAKERRTNDLQATPLYDDILGIYTTKRKKNLAPTLPSGGKP